MLLAMPIFAKRSLHVVLRHAAQLEGHVRRHPRIDGGVVLAVAGAAVAAYFVARAQRPTAEELERRRCDLIARTGRITDGLLIDVRSLENESGENAMPEVLFYSYRLAGVVYHCAQDVSRLPEQVRGYRIELPIQVRYDVRNPGNSIVAAESWSGVNRRPEAAQQRAETDEHDEASRA
jgi:hypothetical protein